VSSTPKEEVRAFWDSEACGERYGDDQDRRRYELEPEILDFADFPSARGQRLLEIGVGMGADYVRWLRAGARATGVDLTERAVHLTRTRAEAEGLVADVRSADAENLPFPDGEFDVVYSWGVLHHTPDMPKSFAEAKRVLRPGGLLKVMVYHRHSWVALAAWARFGLLRGRPLGGLKAGVAHMESPGTQALTRDELAGLLEGLDEVTITPRLTSWDRRVAPGLARLGGDRLGWFLMAQGRAPLR
jgi:SAM-dependent methyltransferase